MSKVKGHEGNYALAIFRHIQVLGTGVPRRIPFHRRASRQSLGSGKLSPGSASGTLGFRLCVLPMWVPHHSCLPAPVLSGSLRGFLKFHGTQNLHGGMGRATLHFLLQARGNSNTSGKKEASLDPIMASTRPLASMHTALETSISAHI